MAEQKQDHMAASRNRIGAHPARIVLQWLVGALLAMAAATALATPRSLRFERIGLEQGLSQESVLNILQDRQGFMWFGTQAGLNRFDGYRMTLFRNDPDDAASLPDNYVTSSYEDEEGRLWFGTKGGLARFDSTTQKFVRYIPAGAGPGASMRGVSALVPDGKGGLWLGSGGGLRHFDPASGRFVWVRHDGADPASLADDRVTALALDGAGALWVGTANGLDKLEPGARGFRHFRVRPEADAQRNNILSLSMGPRATLWVGTAAGLEAWRVGEAEPERRHVAAAEGVGDVRVSALYHDAGATLWVGTDLDGLKWLDPATGQFVSYRNEALDRHSLSDNQVGAIRVDRTGTLWVGTLFGGVNRVDLASGGFVRFKHTPGESGGLGGNKVRAIADAGDGWLWIGTTGGGLTRFDPATGRAEHFRHDPARQGSLADDVVTALARSGDKLWVGTALGLAWRDRAGGRFVPVALGADPNANYIQALRMGRDGTLWIVTRNGLFALPPGGAPLRSWRHDPADPASLGDNYGYALLEDSSGIIWIGTDSGLDRFDRATGTFTHFRHDPRDPDSLRHARVYSLLESTRGELWVGTAGGLHRMVRQEGKAPRFRIMRITDTHLSLPIGAVLEDTVGTLWASSTVGISRLDPASGKYKAYTAEDGLIDGSFFVGAGFASPRGELYFGGVNGMAGFLPSEVRDNPYPPTVLITDFTVFNRSFPLGVPAHQARDITLSYRDAVFALEFAALHYADPHGNRYAYRLEGFDQRWVDTDASKRFATYTNLDPGRYVFHVRASNKDGVWSEAPATLAITITPPFWKTWWFRLLAAGLVLGSVYGGYRLRVRALVQHKDALERQVGARTAELVLQKEAAERRKLEVEQQKEELEQAQRNIARLSEIGRMLTANLDGEAIMATLYEHVRALMDATVFGIGIHRSDRDTVWYPFAAVDGRRVPAYERALSDPHQLAAWCIARGREVFIGDLERECRLYIDDAQPACAGLMALPCASVAEGTPRAVLMVPIVVGERVLGLVTVQSFERHAYRRVHLNMLSTLAAYVGVALDNADAYRQLKGTQDLLAARDKLASLGSLVAGVAHELNTPIGNSLLMASSLRDKTEALAQRFEAAQLRRSELESWIAASTEASSLIMRSLHGAADLVNSFRQVAVDQASAQRRRFDLGQACQEIAATMMKQVRLAGHALEVQVPDGIAMDSFPGPLGQVLINFVNNALLHGFDAPGGRMLLAASTPEPGRVRIEFADEGRGIDPAHLARIFEPFFTTRMGQGGTGLGLNIVYNIVTTLLGGTIRAESQPGQGAVFILDLPLEVPDAVAEAHERGSAHDHY
jgi:ligand-binding sensor domain-containing protein/signal transduction histidine kinase